MSELNTLFEQILHSERDFKARIDKLRECKTESDVYIGPLRLYHYARSTLCEINILHRLYSGLEGAAMSAGDWPGEGPGPLASGRAGRPEEQAGGRGSRGQTPLGEEGGPSGAERRPDREPKDTSCGAGG